MAGGINSVATLSQNLLLQTNVRNIQSQLDKLQLQIASGKKTDVYSGLGSTSRMTLDFHRQKEQIQNYRDTIASTQARRASTSSLCPARSRRVCSPSHAAASP